MLYLEIWSKVTARRLISVMQWRLTARLAAEL